MRGGKRPGAGRIKGAKTVRKQAFAEAAADGGMAPLAYLLAIMRDVSQAVAVRLDAAKTAAPYIHPRLNAVAHTGADGGPIKAATSIRVTFVRPNSSNP